MELDLSQSFQNYQVYEFTISSNLPLSPWLLPSNELADLIIEGRLISGEAPTPNISPLFTSPYLNQQGRPYSYIYRLDKTLYLRMPVIGAFLIDPGKIQVLIQAGTNLIVVCTAVLSFVLSLWLEQRGLKVLHACALSHRGKAIIFMADSTSGKSTLAAALLKTGASLLSDDTVPIMQRTDGFWANPSYPSIRLSKEQIQRFLEENTTLAHWYPGFDKAFVPIGTLGWNTFCNIPQKIQRLYVLQRLPENRCNSVQFENLSKINAVLALIRYSFALYSPLALGMATKRMAFFTQLVSQIDVKRLTYPSGYECLPAVCTTILRDLGSG